eukprot:CAMPEP_0181213550 /NCGR_PEP_ID=MMETSP1096-20121128/24966_1 /TAXON_ID=156174 ORGANISM="Chrysochromulina ericina, Strain CCMP281" /NCGR_SAMPLE_ID=MMETSP1096 /ASSEMBLY_ACC=CAM_ASM_000453 /LENGTH=114 /DNA_ID=CAMNT_0023305199 /DNA_START=76 /DNA_END=420 /DNA_ORIENTATION=-
MASSSHLLPLDMQFHVNDISVVDCSSPSQTRDFTFGCRTPTSSDASASLAAQCFAPVRACSRAPLRPGASSCLRLEVNSHSPVVPRRSMHWRRSVDQLSELIDLDRMRIGNDRE